LKEKKKKKAPLPNWSMGRRPWNMALKSFPKLTAAGKGVPV